MSDYEPAGIINERERPRILLWTTESSGPDQFNWASSRAGTFKRVTDLNDVEPSEWDVLVTDRAHAAIAVREWVLVRSAWSRVPDHLFIFRVFGPHPTPGGSYVEFNVDDVGDAELDRALRIESNIAGHTMSRVKNLPEAVHDLVKSSLLPATGRRGKQFGVLRTGEQLEPAALRLRPFLIGPSGLLMGLSYERPGGAAVWALPADVENLAGWFDAALSEWHVSVPKTFPTVAAWQTDSRWDTREERAARDTLSALEEDFAATRDRFEQARLEAQDTLDEAATRAASGPKSLLTAQGELLQAAALEALVHLGFTVRDMDDEWSERERREDFRVSDPDDPGWLVLADATGVARGAPGSKITTLTGYITKYVLEEKPDVAPGLWVIVNQLIHRDPDTRSDIYRGDDLEVLRAQSGLAIDTAALFLLTREIDADSARAKRCRGWLRSRFGQVTLVDAREWLTASEEVSS